MNPFLPPELTVVHESVRATGTHCCPGDGSRLFSHKWHKSSYHILPTDDNDTGGTTVQPGGSAKGLHHIFDQVVGVLDAAAHAHEVAGNAAVHKLLLRHLAMG